MRGTGPASLSLCPPEPLFLSVPPSCSLFCLFLTLSSIPGHNNGGEHRPDPASPPNTPALALWGAFPSSQPLNPAPANPPIHAHTPHKYIQHICSHICTHTHPHTPTYRHTCAHTLVTHKHTPLTHTPQVYPAVPPSPKPGVSGGVSDSGETSRGAPLHPC